MDSIDDVDINAFRRVLATRDISGEWAYQVEGPQAADTDDITDWLAETCRGKYRLYRRTDKYQVYFEDEQDFVLFQMTWG